MRAWNAFRNALSHTLRKWQLLPILLGVNFVLALGLTLLPASTLLGPAHRPAAAEAADGLDAWLVFEGLLGAQTEGVLVEEGVASLPEFIEEMLFVTGITGLALPVAAWLSGAFLSGGVLLTYVEADQPFRWRRFLWGSWHWFGAFLLLGILQVIGILVILLPLVFLVISATLVGGWLVALALLLLLVVAVLGLAIVEYTRLIAVVRGTRNIFIALNRGILFVARQPLQVLLLYGMALLLLGSIFLLFRGAILPWVELDLWLLVLLLQETFLLTRLWARLVRLNGGLKLYRTASVALQARSPDRAVGRS